jgi:hypothetical protein
MVTAGSSSLLLDEAFAAGDERFLVELLASTSSKKLKAIADPWYGDQRPFARRMLHRYIDDGCDRPHHRPLVKTLFKLAELNDDHETMGHFLVAFDRLVKRKVSKGEVWDSRVRDVVPSVRISEDRSVPEKSGNHDTKAPRFSQRTRRYLRRRAFRFFRLLGRRDPARYGAAIRAALALYQDAHLDTPSQILDAWGLIHALYWGSEVFDRDPRGIRVAPGRSLAELVPAPYCPEAWGGALNALLELVEKAGSRTVRVFTIGLLQRDYAAVLRSVKVARIKGLLKSQHDEVQIFAAQLLQTASGIEGLTVEEWLSLLRIDNVTALPLICQMVVKHLLPARLTLAQCVELACARPAPVAEVGLRWAKQKPINGTADLLAVVGLARAEAPKVREEAITWVAELLETIKGARAEHVRELFDARHANVRALGLALFVRAERYRENMLLWAALSESPYDDVRAFLVRHLKERESIFEPETLRHVWVTILLGVHRGGKSRRAALRQIAERVARRPAEASSLLPLLGIALRSVRPSERRTALAAVGRAAFLTPRLRAAIQRELPELLLESGEVAA